MRETKKSSLEAPQSPKKDYTELVYWVWQYFGVLVIFWGLLEVLLYGTSNIYFIIIGVGTIILSIIYWKFNIMFYKRKFKK